MFNSFSYKNKYMFYVYVILIILFILFILSFLKPPTLPSNTKSNPNTSSSIGASTETNASLAEKREKERKKAEDDKLAADIKAASTPAEREACFKAREYCLNSGNLGINECISTFYLREYGRDPNNFTKVSYYKQPWVSRANTPSPCTAFGPNGCGDCSALHFYNNRKI
jgi:hypothetical protein